MNPLENPDWLALRVAESYAIAEMYRKRAEEFRGAAMHQAASAAAKLYIFWTETAETLRERELKLRRAAQAPAPAVA